MENSSSHFRLLRLGPLHLAVDEESVLTVVEYRNPTPLPFAPDAVLGIVSVQGRMFTVLNLLKLSKSSEVEVESGKTLIVALRGDEQLALAVDDAAQVVEIENADIRLVTSPVTELLQTTFGYRDVDWQLIDINNLFSSVISGRERRRRRS